MERWLNNVCASFLLCAFVLIFCLHTAGASAKADSATFYVATDGDDANPGTKARPFATLAKAKEAVRSCRQRGKKPITVLVGEGTYYQAEPLVFGPQDSGATEAPVTYQAQPGRIVTISGGQKLDCKWRRHKKGIMKCELAEVKAGATSSLQMARSII